MKISKMRDLETGKFPAYAWPGGYPIIYLCEDGEVVCADCLNDPENRGWAFEERGSRATASDVYEEGPTLQCANCNAEIESAYGDPDNETDCD